LGVRIFLDSLGSVITVITLLTAWTGVLDPVRSGGGADRRTGGRQPWARGRQRCWRVDIRAARPVAGCRDPIGSTASRRVVQHCIHL